MVSFPATTNEVVSGRTSLEFNGVVVFVAVNFAGREDCVALKIDRILTFATENGGVNQFAALKAPEPAVYSSLMKEPPPM